MTTPLERAWWMPGVGEERMGGVEMPSRKDDPDARLTIGYSSYRLPRSGLVQHRFLTKARHEVRLNWAGRLNRAAYRVWRQA